MTSIKNTFFLTKRVIFAASIGNMLEMYSFSLYALLLPVLSPLFFPSDDPFGSLLSSYLVFAVGFLAYPLGALIFGYIGDKYGRKVALSTSLLGMAIATFLIGILPTYSMVGLIASFLLALLRTMQGICSGGECMGAGILIIEYVLKKNPSFFGSLAAASGTFGALLAAFLSTLLISPLFPLWSWRILFILSIFIGFVGIYLRNSIGESPIFDVSTVKSNTSPIKEIFKHHFISFSCAVGLGALGTVPFYLIIGFLNSYLVTLGSLSLSNSVYLNFLLVFFCAVTLPVAGYIADKIGISKTMELSASCSLAFSYPFFYLIYSDSLILLVVAELGFLGLSQFYVAPLNAFISQLFPTHSRFSGASFGYCVGMAFFGGTSPYISLFLVTWTGIKTLPFLYLAFVCFIGLLAVLIGKKRGVQQVENLGFAY